MAYISFQPKDYFNTLLYTDNGANRTLTGVGFQPDWVWIKTRNHGNSHNIFDAVRGANKNIRSNSTAAEVTTTDTLTAFTSDGFSLGVDASGYGVNYDNKNEVAWNWKAGGAGSSNTDGSITTTVSANTTAGFSIVKWTAGSGVSGIGHGLGVVPKLIICKDLSASSAWTVGSDLLNDWGGYLGLQSTNALNSETRMYKPSGYSSPTASLFYQDHSAFGSAGENMIAYCFAEKKGFSKFGSYAGNGNADGAFVYTGFKPAMVLFKQSSASGEKWYIYDNKRNAFNITNSVLFPNASDAESSATTGAPIDMLSNGFKLKGTDAAGNGSGSTYIFMAFAEEPLVSSNGVPATAR